MKPTTTNFNPPPPKDRPTAPLGPPPAPSSIINHKFEYVDGGFDMESGELICVGNYKYGCVHLCFKEGANITFAKVKLHSRDLAVDAAAVFDDAKKLGDEIARRWNAHNSKPQAETPA